MASLRSMILDNRFATDARLSPKEIEWVQSLAMRTRERLLSREVVLVNDFDIRVDRPPICYPREVRPSTRRDFIIVITVAKVQRALASAQGPRRPRRSSSRGAE